MIEVHLSVQVVCDLCGHKGSALKPNKPLTRSQAYQLLEQLKVTDDLCGMYIDSSRKTVCGKCHAIRTDSLGPNRYEPIAYLAEIVTDLSEFAGRMPNHSPIEVKAPF